MIRNKEEQRDAFEHEGRNMEEEKQEGGGNNMETGRHGAGAIAKTSCVETTRK